MSSPHDVGAAPLEVEAKLRGSRRAFDALEQAAQAGEIAGWRVVDRRAVRLRDTYWDTPDRRLASRGCTLRVREVLALGGAQHPAKSRAPQRPAGESTVPGAEQRIGARAAELTFKGQVGYTPTSLAGSRPEVTAATPAGAGPADWVHLPAAQPVLAALRTAGGPAAPGAPDVLARLRPDVVLLNPRREFLLRQEGGDAGGSGQAVLSLDEVRIEGQPYRRRYVEIELKRGHRSALDRLVRAAAAQFGLRPSRTGKVQAARAWLARRGTSPPAPERLEVRG